MSQRHTLEHLKWGVARTGEQVAKILLFPGDYLYIEPGESIYGPAHLTVIKYGKRSYKYQVKPLPKQVFDIDNPYEYPCKSCGAPRHSACTGSKPDCAYRVFHYKGGVL